ncbi:MAG: endonuclease III [archaeon]
MDSELAVRQLKAIERLVEEFGESPRLAAEGWGEDWKTLIAIILSAQTRDSKTVAVCEKLFEKYPRVENLAGADLGKIEKDIGSINYYKTKAKNIRETAKILVSRGVRFQNSGIRKTEDIVRELMKLPGVGRKTANVYLVASRNAAAIGVDTHVGRISRKMGWTKEEESHRVEKDLKKLFPREYWNSINWILVSFGQSVGRSRVREDEVLGKLL